jgi:hypothetical protein
MESNDEEEDEDKMPSLLRGNSGSKIAGGMMGSKGTPFMKKKENAEDK